MATKKTIKETVEKAVQAAEPVIAEAKKKAEPVIAEAMKKAEPMAEKAKKTAKTAAEKATPAMKKAEAKAKEGSKAIRAALAPEVYIQLAGKELNCNEIQERCRAAYKETSKKAIRSIAVYIKPEDNAAYYVINGEQGKIEL